MEPKDMSILLVEDNIDLCDDLCFQLKKNDYHLDAVHDAKTMDVKMAEQGYSIVILDIGLPGEDGLSIATRLRQHHPDLGIIMMTARGEIETKVQGLTTGADSYLVKPVDWRELAAVIESLQRRIQKSKPTKPTKSTWLLKEAGRVLITPRSEKISLTSMEGQIMTLLAQHAETPVQRNVIIETVARRGHSEFDPRRLEVCISRLRQKLMAAFNAQGETELVKDNLPVKSVRGVGYIFTQSIDIQ